MNISYLLRLGGYNGGRCQRWRRLLGTVLGVWSQVDANQVHWCIFREHWLPCYWDPYLCRRSETTSPILPTVPKRHRPIRASLGRTCINTRPPEVNLIAAVAFVILQVIPRLIDELSHHLSVGRFRVISVAFLIHTSAIHHPQRQRFPKSNGMDENIPPPPVPTSHNSTKTHCNPLPPPRFPHPRICLLLPLRDPFVLTNR